MLLEDKQNEIERLNADFSAYGHLVYVVLFTDMYIVNFFFLLELRRCLKREEKEIKENKELKTGKTRVALSQC